MARKHHHEENHNHERWLVSYADFITLLFAFFVVMYSISSDEGKYKVLTDSLEAVFNNTPDQKSPISMIENDANNVSSANHLFSLPLLTKEVLENHQPLVMASDDSLQDNKTQNVKIENSDIATSLPEKNNLKTITSQLQESFSGLIEQDLLSINANDQWIEVDIKSSILFASGQASLSYSAQEVIQKIASVLVGYENAIQVEGFTDNVPIETSQYPSNWELSSARAAAIVRLMVDASIKPERLAAVGYGEFQPIADNESELGRQKNRRVVLVISKDLSVRHSL
jgi:chemotaxis protein MotB